MCEVEWSEVSVCVWGCVCLGVCVGVMCVCECSIFVFAHKPTPHTIPKQISSTCQFSEWLIWWEVERVGGRSHTVE